MSDKKKILFITKHVVHSRAAMAGHQLFNYYLNRFVNDGQFEVSYMVAHKNDDAYNKMHQEFGKRANDYSVQVPKLLRLFTYVFYNYQFVRLFFAFIKPEWYYLDPVYGHYYKKAIKNSYKKGYRPDVIVFEWTEMIFLENYCSKFFGEAMKVATEHDVSFIKMARKFANSKLITNLFVKRFQQREIEILNKLQLILVLSKDDKDRLDKAGVDVKRIHLLSPFYQRFNVKGDHSKAQIVFYGAMNRIENEEAVTWFIDKVYNQFGLDALVDFLVVGAGVPNSLVKNHAKQPRITFTGFVEKPEEYFKSAMCMVVPLLNGGGIKIKVLEGMSCALPVITNEIGIEGISAVDDVSYLHCEVPEDYDKAIRALLIDPELAINIGQNGKMLVDNNYNFENSFNEYKAIVLNS
jgi:glycosyltransferase involved in cell wall biosynthesis